MTHWPLWLLWASTWLTLAGASLLCGGLLWLAGRAEARRGWAGGLLGGLCALGLLPVLLALLFVRELMGEIMRRMGV